MTNPTQISLTESLNFIISAEKSGYGNVSIEKVQELSELKALFKQEYRETEEYQLFKTKLRHLRQSKLPFRYADMIKSMNKRDEKVPSALRNYAPGKKLSKAEGREYCRKREEEWVRIYRNSPEREKLAVLESVHWVHGTNSGALSLIPRTGYTFLCTGELLDRGVAPMCGELTQGGMVTNGINQVKISAETVRNLSRSWKYATEISKSFDPEKYETGYSLFIEALETLAESTPDSDAWDQRVIKLLRFKQWNPIAFWKLVEENQELIARVTENVENTYGTMEKLVIKALEYDEGRLQKAQTDLTIRKEIEDEFQPARIGIFCWHEWWGGKLIDHDAIQYFITRGYIFDHLFHKEIDETIVKVLRLRSFWDSQVKDLKEEAEKDELSALFLKRLGPNCDREQFLDTYVRQKVTKRLEHCMLPYKKRLQRFFNLFEQKESPEFTESEKMMICNPFPMMLASGKSNAFTLTGSEYYFHKGTLGEEIDILFTTKEHTAQLEAWLQTHHLDDKVRVYDESFLSLSSTSIPLYHSPDYVASEKSFMEGYELNNTNKSLNKHVFPLYAKPYPDGRERKYHGVAHAARTAFFAYVIGSLYEAEGQLLSTKKEHFLVAAGDHDNARENDGTDLWDEESGMRCQETLEKELEASPEQALLLKRSIAEKDSKTVFALEQKVIHDADCLEIFRCLRSPKDFDDRQLYLLRDLGAEKGIQLVKEAEQFIALTESPRIKAFIESSNNPFSALFQILAAAMGERKFGFLESVMGMGCYTLASPSKSEMTSEIRKEIASKC